MKRPSFDDVAFGYATLAAQRSTCPRLHTGAVITTQDDRVLCTGYNGSLPGTPHCDDSIPCDNCAGRGLVYDLQGAHACPKCGANPDTGVQLGCLIIEDHCKRTVHAEANAITQAARYGTAIVECKMYTLHEPCLDCTQLIISSGISKVYILQEYRSEETVAYLAQLGVNRNMFEFIQP